MKNKATEYEMGKFIIIDDPLVWGKDTLEETLENLGYILHCRLPDSDLPYIEIWHDEFKHDTHEVHKYEYIAYISFNQSTINDIYFENWFDLLHFLENYTNWIKNIYSIEKSFKDL